MQSNKNRGVTLCFRLLLKMRSINVAAVFEDTLVDNVISDNVPLLRISVVYLSLLNLYCY